MVVIVTAIAATIPVALPVTVVKAVTTVVATLPPIAAAIITTIITIVPTITTVTLQPQTAILTSFLIYVTLLIIVSTGLLSGVKAFHYSKIYQ